MNEHLTQETLALLQSRQSYTYSQIPFDKKGDCGVYIIKFPNGKRYVGSSNHVFKRLERHILGLENQYSSNVLWYQTAAAENGIKGRAIYNYLDKDIKRSSLGYTIDYNYLNVKFKLTPPPKDPRNKCDKRGHRIGNRIKNSVLKKYNEEFAAWKELVEQEKDERGYYDYEAKLYTIIEDDSHSWRRKNKIVSKLLVNVFYCDDYREFETAILKSIPEDHRKYWYNSKFY